jgi:hypothetical protein
MYTVDVSVVGISPLIQHRYPLPDFNSQTKGGKKSTGAVNYDDEWKGYFYADGEGKIYQPASHFDGALKKASVNFKVTGKRGKSYRDLISANVFVTPDMIYHEGFVVPEHLDTDADKPLYIDYRPVVVQRARVARARPTFKTGWKLSFQLEVIDDEVPAEVLQDILALAGKTVGIGDFRPRFGRFNVSHYEVLK